LFLLPQWSPVLVAEQVGTLACLHGDQFIVQTGLGGDPRQFAALGQSTDHRVSVFEEGVRIVQALLAGEVVSSERFGFEDASIGLVPDRPVDWWMGTGADSGVRRAARFGAAWYTGPGKTFDAFRASDEIYRSACEEHGTRPRVMMRRDALVLSDGPRAHAIAGETVERGYRGLRQDQLLVGTPAEVAEQLAPWAEAGVQQVVVRTMGIEPAVDLETIDCLAEVKRLLAH
jgi:alkanesulfonate monooxygenase SsuD/methylene tetrahydromethanopterin reductase-like flavin-dependent oxidoreductase (luciferase family)